MVNRNRIKISKNWIDSPMPIKAQILDYEISGLEEILEREQFRLNHTALEGVPSIKSFMIHTSFVPMGLFLLIKILFGFFALDGPVAILNLSMQASTVLGMYFAVPATMLMFVFALVGKGYYKENLQERERLETSIRLLQDEIETKKLLRATMKFILEQPTKSEIGESLQRMIERKDLIKLLTSFKKNALWDYKRGTLDEYLRELGISEQYIAESRAIVEKSLVLEPKNKSVQTK